MAKRIYGGSGDKAPDDGNVWQREILPDGSFSPWFRHEQPDYNMLFIGILIGFGIWALARWGS